MITKNTEVDQHRIREALASLVIHLAHTSTTLQVADNFTKAMKTEAQVSYCQKFVVGWKTALI